MTIQKKKELSYYCNCSTVSEDNILIYSKNKHISIDFKSAPVELFFVQFIVIIIIRALQEGNPFETIKF